MLKTKTKNEKNNNTYLSPHTCEALIQQPRLCLLVDHSAQWMACSSVVWLVNTRK